ncbi:unnamed protein product, partial [Ixodes hexagonus]
LSCYDIKVKALSDLRSGSLLLNLVSSIDSSLCPENVNPSEAFSRLECFLGAFHGCLPAHFLSQAAHGGNASQLDLAVASVLALSALFVKATSPSGTGQVGPLMQLEQGIQQDIKDMLQIVTGGDGDVLPNLMAHLEASPDEDSPENVRHKMKRKKSHCFTYSPSPVRLPLKKRVDSPSQLSNLSAERAKELKRLRQQVKDEEQHSSELLQQIATQNDAIVRKDKEISILQQKVICLDSNLSDTTSECTALKDPLFSFGVFFNHSLQKRNSFLEQQVCTMDSLKSDYDEVIRENCTLKQQCADRVAMEATIGALQATVTSAHAAKDELSARLADVEQQRDELASRLAEKGSELDSLLEHYASRERQALLSPTSPPPPGTPGVSCFAELRIAELEDANRTLEAERDRLKAQLDSLTAQFKTEADRLRSSLTECKEALRSAEQLRTTLQDEVSSLGGKLQSSEEVKHTLQKANADLQTSATANREQLRDAQLQLEDLSRRHDSVEREAHALHRSSEELRVQNQALQSSLKTSEASRAEAAQTIRALRDQMDEVLAAREKDSSSLRQLRHDCETLRAQNESAEASLAATRAQLAESQARCGCLCEESQSLRGQIGDLEVQLGNLLRLKKQAEDYHSNFVQESEKNETALKERIESLSSEARDFAISAERSQSELSKLREENGRLAREVERLSAEVDEAGKRASDNCMQKEMLLEQLRLNNTQCDALAAQCKLLDEEKQKLNAELKTQMDSLMAQFNAEADHLRASLAESEQAVRSLDKLRTGCQDEVSSLRKELQTSTDERNALLKANSELQTFAAAETQKLRELQCQLDDTSQQRNCVDQEAHTLREANETLLLRIQSLESSLEVSENSCVEAMRTIGTLRDQLQRALLAQERDASSLRQLQWDCEVLRTQNGSGEASLRSTCAQLTESQARCLQLEEGNGALRGRIGDLETQVKDLLRLEKQAKENCQKCIEETEKSKEVLKAQVDALTSEARDSASLAERSRSEVSRLCEDNSRLLHEVERLNADMEEARKRANDSLVQKERELQEQVTTASARYEAATAQCQLLEKQKEQLEVDLKAQLDSLATRFSAEADHLRTSRTVSEQAVRSMKELQTRSQDELSSLKKKLETSEKEQSALHRANGELQAFMTTGSQQLQDLRSQLSSVSQQRDAAGQEVCALRKANETLQLQNRSLRSCLEASEARRTTAEASCAKATQSAHALEGQLQQTLSARKEDASALQKLQQDCADLRAQNESGEASLMSSRSQLAAAEERCGRLDDENQALRDRIGDLEVQLKNLAHLKQRAEDDYYKCVEEKEKHKDALKELIESLSSEARESKSEASMLREDNGLLALEVERLRAELEDAVKRASDGQKEELQEQSGLDVARCEAATARCELLEKENEQLKAELKISKDSMSQKLRTAFLEMTTETNKRMSAFKKTEVALREEIQALKKESEEDKAAHKKREKLVHKHVDEMKSRVSEANRDIETLKEQLASNDTELSTVTSERNRLAAEVRSLKAQVDFCERKMKEQAAKGKGSANSLSASNESLWSQQTSLASLCSLGSSSSLASDQFKVPFQRPASRRDSTLRATSASFAQTTALDSSIFSESRYSCDEEQDMFTQTNLTDLGHKEDEDPLRRYSELYRRNSMLHPHLKSSYPVETQASSIPATPLKSSSPKFLYPDALPTTASSSSQDDVSKRKRSTRSESSGSGGSNGAVAASTPRASRTGTSRAAKALTPSSVKKFIKRTFKKP